MDKLFKSLGGSMMTERIFLYDFIEDARVRYISFTANLRRFDLAIVITDQFFGKMLILDLQSNRYAIIGHDDLEEENYLEEVYELTKEEGTELRSFLYELL